MHKIIIYKDLQTEKEICKDLECLFTPQVNNLLQLGHFPASNIIDKTHVHVVKSITISYNIMYVFVNKHSIQ